MECYNQICKYFKHTIAQMQTKKISIFQMKEKETFSIFSLKYIQQLNVLTIYQILISMEMKIH